MTDQFLDQVGVQAVALGGYSIAALLIVFVMRNKAPVWGLAPPRHRGRCSS